MNRDHTYDCQCTPCVYARLEMRTDKEMANRITQSTMPKETVIPKEISDKINAEYPAVADGGSDMLTLILREAMEKGYLLAKSEQPISATSTMSEKMTPLQSSIQYFQENLNGLRVNMQEVKKPSDKNVATEITLMKVINDLKSLLPNEEQVIIDAYDAGKNDEIGGRYTKIGNDYYSQVFKSK